MSAMKAIYAGLRACGIGDEVDRRDFYERVTGKRGLRVMTPTEQEAVLAELRRMGFRSVQGDGGKPDYAHPSRVKLDGPYAKKLQALWISGWNLGLVEHREDAALLAFVRRQTGLEHTRFLRDPHEAAKVVEALKNWIHNKGGVVWGESNGYDWLVSDPARVAWAQWRRLYPDASLLDLTAFSAAIRAIIGPRVGLHLLKRADWRAVMNAFGVTIRKNATDKGRIAAHG